MASLQNVGYNDARRGPATPKAQEFFILRVLIKKGDTMLIMPDEKTMEAIIKLFPASGSVVHVTPVMVCDNCENQDKEAFPYHVHDSKGKYWQHLCNDCFDSLGCRYEWIDYWSSDSFSNITGDTFNIEVVCPKYDLGNYAAFTWYRDERGTAVVTGYDPKKDERVHWLCDCGHYEEGGCHCSECGAESPWGCDCGDHDDHEDEIDFGYEIDPYEAREPDFDEEFWDL